MAMANNWAYVFATRSVLDAAIGFVTAGCMFKQNLNWYGVEMKIYLVKEHWRTWLADSINIQGVMLILSNAVQ
jgi:hypothetical protein